MPDIPPLVIAPDEADREMIRQLIFEAEAAGKPERVYRIVEDALYAAWGLVDDLRAQLAERGAQGPEGEG